MRDSARVLLPLRGGAPRAAVARHDVVDGQVAAVGSAVLADVPVTGEHLSPAELDSRAGSPDQVDQANDRWGRDRQGRGVDHLVVSRDQPSLVGAEQVEGAPDVTDVERLRALVEDKYRRVEQSAPPVGADDSNGRPPVPARGPRRGREYNGWPDAARGGVAGPSTNSHNTRLHWPPSRRAPGRRRSSWPACCWAS